MRGGVAHRLEQAAHNRLVVGSIPTTPTKTKCHLLVVFVFLQIFSRTTASMYRLAAMKIGAFFDKVAGAKEPKPIQKATEVTEIRVPALPVKHTASMTKFAVGVVVVGASFYLGTAYQKSQQTNTSSLSTNSSSQSNQNGSGFSGNGRFYRSSMSTSTVTAVSNSNITVQDSSGSTKTYTINSNTVITDSGEQVTASDIQTGDTVVVIPERTDNGVARRIFVNPDFGGIGNSQPVTIDPGQTQLN
jgi:hypothetical protein